MTDSCSDVQGAIVEFLCHQCERHDYCAGSENMQESDFNTILINCIKNKLLIRESIPDQFRSGILRES